MIWKGLIISSHQFSNTVTLHKHCLHWRKSVACTEFLCEILFGIIQEGKKSRANDLRDVFEEWGWPSSSLCVQLRDKNMKFARSIKQISGMSGGVRAIMAAIYPLGLEYVEGFPPLFWPLPFRNEHQELYGFRHVSRGRGGKADGVFNGNPMHKKLWSSFFS